MPVIARFSKLFYDRLGEEIANELVELINQVDSTSRKDLRDLNELNFARFDAKLEQRVVQTTAHIDGLATTLDAKIDRVAAELRATMAGLASKEDLANLRASVEHGLLVQTRWMFAMWGTLTLAIVALP